MIGTGDLPPSYLIPIYQAAARRYHLPWQVLAAINGIETDYGRNVSASSAGAIGWMQFMPATWSEYAVSVGGKGAPSPYDPRAAIFAAAHLLAANGGAQHLRQAIYAYNHASWYVDAVVWRQQLITDWAAKDQRTSAVGYALPLTGKYMSQLGRTDEGVDIETAPDGAAVYSISAGVVTAVASDPAGFGPDYPVIRVTSGPLTGHYIYYGHVAASLVHVGEHVAAGQPIAVMGHTGDAASLGHGHIEIGFSDAAGNPLNHPGTAATASGSAMRSFLVELSGAFGIHNS
ncbi:MAG TPA: lytic murein transglycosylase [Solirubrobacteraceae bacterium]|nr:lytic murein transglycosylase [Solirubrobacteraceae bacterium]